MSEQSLQNHRLKNYRNISRILSKHGIKTILFGSVARDGSSKHDVDVLVLAPQTSVTLAGTLFNILKPYSSVEKTDWRGLFFHETRFGNVDVFFLDRLFDLAEQGKLKEAAIHG